MALKHSHSLGKSGTVSGCGFHDFFTVGCVKNARKRIVALCLVETWIRVADGVRFSGGSGCSLDKW